MARRRRNDDAIGELLREWGTLTRSELEGKPVEWPLHQLPIVLAVERMNPTQRHALEVRFANPGLSAFDRPAAVGMSHTRYHAALGSARAFIEGALSVAAYHAR